jgi:hypothetical protein
MGIEPKLALVYDSDGGNDLMGVGFKLEGLSSISRCGLDITHDGVVRAISYDNRDAICLDGKRLHLVSGDHWQSGAEYRTQPDELSKVTILQGERGIYFKVYARNGTIWDYGITPTNRLYFMPSDTERVQTWYVDRISDRSSNYMTVDYVYPELLPNSMPLRLMPYDIVYTKSSVGDPQTNTVHFDYAQTPDITSAPAAISAYRQGQLRSMKSQLNKIVVTSYGGYERTYRLDYERSPTTSYQRVSAVTECALDVCKPSTLFTWYNGGEGVISPKEPAWSNPYGRFERFQTGITAEPSYAPSQAVDIDGDGRDELVHFKGSSLMYLSDLDTFNPVSAHETIILSHPSFERYEMEDAPVSLRSVNQNQDGLVDFIAGYRDNPNNGSNASFHLIKSALPGLYNVYPFSDNVGVADMNGDGLLDSIYTKFKNGISPQPDTIQYGVKLHDGSTFSQEIILNAPTPYSSSSGATGGWTYFRVWLL